MNPKVIEDIPQKPLTAFFLYKNDKFEEHYERMKEMSFCEVTYHVSNMWKKEDPEIKRKYEELGIELKNQYEREKDAFELKWGSITDLKKRYKKVILKEKMKINKKRKEAAILTKK